MQTLNEMLSSLSRRAGDILPDILGALIVLIVGIIIAKILRRVVMALLQKTTIDDRIGKRLNTSFRIDKFISSLVYYLVLLFVLLLVLDMMNVRNVLAPLQNMLNDFVTFIPKIIAAGIIGYAGYVIAQIASEGVGFLTQRLEGFSDKIGLTDSVDLAKIVKQLVFVFVFIPILIIALDTLNLHAISDPAVEMLSEMMNAIPNIIAAAIIIAVFYFVGKYAIAFVVGLLKNLNVDQMANKLGISQITGTSSLSQMLGNIAFFFLMFAGLIAAMDKLNLTSMTEILENIFQITGKIFFGLIILAIGNYISKLAADTLAQTEKNSWLASIVRFATLGIFLAISLSTMGIGEDIVRLAFGLTLGSAAVAIALSFGLGGREAAGKTMESWLKKFRD